MIDFPEPLIAIENVDGVGQGVDRRFPYALGRQEAVAKIDVGFS